MPTDPAQFDPPESQLEELLCLSMSIVSNPKSDWRLIDPPQRERMAAGAVGIVMLNYREKPFVEQRKLLSGILENERKKEAEKAIGLGLIYGDPQEEAHLIQVVAPKEVEVVVPDAPLRFVLKQKSFEDRCYSHFSTPEADGPWRVNYYEARYKDRDGFALLHLELRDGSERTFYDGDAAVRFWLLLESNWNDETYAKIVRGVGVDRQSVRDFAKQLRPPKRPKPQRD